LSDRAGAVVELAGRSIEVETISGDADKAAIVMLHEGLGSVAMWRDFPELLAQRTGRTVVAYSRYGHGRSEPLQEPRTPAYMHHEGETVLLALIAELELQRPVLFGHSDGASIALIFAARYPQAASALILEAPHVFVEEVTVASIARVKATLPETDVVQRLRRYHADAAKTFWGWNDIWLHPDFRGWDIRDCLGRITVPALLMQGRDDEYGTTLQLDTIAAALPSVDIHLFDRSGHSPHRTHPETVADLSAAFLARS